MTALDKLRASISLSTSVLPNPLARQRTPSPPPPTTASNPKEIIFHNAGNDSSSTSLQSNNDRASSDSSIRPSSTALRIAVLDDIVASDPDATLSEYTLSAAKDLTKSRKFGSSKDIHPNTLIRAAGYGLRKHLAIHTGKEDLDKRWEEVKSKDVVEHGSEALGYPDTLIIATTWDDRKDSGFDGESGSGATEKKTKAIVSRVWSMKKQIPVGEVVWNHVGGL